MTTSERCVKAARPPSTRLRVESEFQRQCLFQVVEDGRRSIDVANRVVTSTIRSRTVRSVATRARHPDTVPSRRPRARLSIAPGHRAIDAAATGSRSMSAKMFSGRLMQFAGDGRVDFGPGARRHPVLKSSQPADVSSRENVRPRGGELTTFEQRSTERGRCLQHAVGATLVLPVPVPRLHQRRQPFRPFSERGIGKHNICRNAGHNQGAGERPPGWNQARGMLLRREPGLHPEECIGSGQVAQARRRSARSGVPVQS